MTVHRLIPPPHPGKVLRSRLEGLNPELTQGALADALGVSRLSINQVLNGRRSITADMAVRLEAVLATSPSLWMKLQWEYDLFEARQRIGAEVKKLAKLVALPNEAPA